MKLFTFFFFSVLVFAEYFVSHPPLIGSGYQFNVHTYQADNNGSSDACVNYPYQPTRSDPVVHYIEASDCVYDSNSGNYDCTDSSTMVSRYVVLSKPSFADTMSYLYDDSYQFSYLRVYNVNSLSGIYDDCVSYSAPISIIAQSPVQLPSCDPATTDFQSDDIYGLDHNVGYCVCKPGYLPTSDPLVCEAHDWSW